MLHAAFCTFSTLQKKCGIFILSRLNYPYCSLKHWIVIHFKLCFVPFPFSFTPRYLNGTIINIQYVFGTLFGKVVFAALFFVVWLSVNYIFNKSDRKKQLERLDEIYHKRTLKLFLAEFTYVYRCGETCLFYPPALWPDLNG